MSKSISLWDDNSEPTTSAILLYSSQCTSFIELIDEKLIQRPEFIFSINDEHKNCNFIFLKYLSYKYDLEITDTNASQLELFFEQWDSCIQDFSLFSTTSFNCYDMPILYKTNYLLELLKKISLFRNNVLSNSPYLGHETRYFDHAWWNSSMLALDPVNSIKSKLSKTNKPQYNELFNYLDSILSLFSKLKSSNLETQLITASAFLFASGKYNARKKENDKALLLLHRSLDLAFQSIAACEGKVRSTNEGLSYTNNNKQVSFEATKRILLDAGILSISETHLKAINKINFSRNRSVLTHSFFSITSEELEILYVNTHKALVTILDLSDKWKKDLRIFLSKPKLSNDILFSVEESFDSLLKKI